MRNADLGRFCEIVGWLGRRTVSLQRRGWHVIRFWNNDILGNAEGVIQTILQILSAG
jgi:very-short-patch-repair endonuclease